MEALLYFIFWGALIFLMMRLGCGAHIMGHVRDPGDRQGLTSRSGRQGLRWVPPETDADPVCGQTVRTATAKPSVYDGAVFYFCSRECREVFEAAPHLYVGGQSAADQQKLESHHA